MSTRRTLPVLVHGANQSARSLYDEKKKITYSSYEEMSNAAWDEALDKGEKILRVLNGSNNEAIETYHQNQNPGQDVPAYEFYKIEAHAVFYGDIWNTYCSNCVPDGDGGYTYKEPRLGSLRDDYEIFKELMTGKEPAGKKLHLLAKERGAMDKFFAELVPFYELYTLTATGTTLYSEICESFLDDLTVITEGGTVDYVLLAHSMGCAVTYNFLVHLSNLREGRPLVNAALNGVLAESYMEKLNAFNEARAECLGLLTFGNYTAYNYAQRCNHHILFGGFETKYPYPKAARLWRNYYTALGGDPYIIDDTLGKAVTGGTPGQFKDVRIARIPLTNIGHGRDNWFRRNDFERDVVKTLTKELIY